MGLREIPAIFIDNACYWPTSGALELGDVEALPEMTIRMALWQRRGCSSLVGRLPSLRSRKDIQVVAKDLDDHFGCTVSSIRSARKLRLCRRLVEAFVAIDGHTERLDADMVSGHFRCSA